MGISDTGGGGGTDNRGPISPDSTKPYLIRAIYEWAIDNGLTPQVLVSTVSEDVIVPPQYIKEDQIVLNIHPQSVQSLELGNDYLMCSARFSGKPFEISVPVFAVMAVYARENGRGIVFQNDDSPPPSRRDSNGTKTAPTQGAKSDGKSGLSPHLKLIK